MEAVILEALALQTFFRQLPEAERKKLAQEVSEEHVSIQLAQWQSALTYAERAAAEADRDLQQARKILATKEGQICSMSMKSVQCRLSCLTLLYEARLRAVSKRWSAAHTPAGQARLTAYAPTRQKPGHARHDLSCSVACRRTFPHSRISTPAPPHPPRTQGCHSPRSRRARQDGSRDGVL
jgi:hypothetical protein